MELFGDLDWAICMFDNVLILAHDYDDAYCKLDQFLDRCIEHHVALKFPKTWLGFDKVHFFGYNCRHSSYELTEDRKKALLEIPFPELGNRQKKARSLLGVGVFFAPFIVNYKDRVRHLTDLTKKDFNWNESTWKHDYRQEWELYKKGLQESCTIYYPDYELEWILRTDASEFGVGAVLIQILIHPDGRKEEQVIAVCSKKFSEQATKWSTIEQEGYGIYYAVKRFAYYLIGKRFTIETDHNNLLWMEASEVPKIIRWRVYLQSFDFLIRHISGTKNTVADALSRLFVITCDDTEYLNSWEEEMYEQCVDERLHALFEPEITVEGEVVPKSESVRTPDELMHEVHNAQVGHCGVKELYTRLNKQFPGHGIAYKQVEDFIDRCACCQKTRKECKSRLVKIPRTLKPPHSRSAIGIDAVKITPAGKEGHTHITVILNLFCKHVYLYPVKSVSAKNLAAAVWSYWSNFGHTDMVISDQGSDLTSNLFSELISLMGMRMCLALPTSMLTERRGRSRKLLGTCELWFTTAAYQMSSTTRLSYHRPSIS